MKRPFSEKPNKDGGKASAFAESIARFFNPEPQKEKILRHEDFAAAGDPYYATVSARYKIAQRIIIILLVLFLLISIFTNIREITYGNFFYFIRDFGNAVDIDTTSYETLAYDVYSDQVFSLYRGGVAAVSPSNVSVFTATGRRTLKSRSDFVMPYAVGSEKYLLVYDLSGNSFAVYNSFSKVYTETLGAPITDGAISDSGVFAVVSSSTEYRSVISVYNDNMKILGKYSKDAYVFDVAVDAEGKRMAVIYFEIGDGRGKTTFRVYDISNRQAGGNKDPDEDRILSETVMDYVFPLSCSFVGEDKTALVTNGGIWIYDEEYELHSSLEFSDTLSAFYTGENGAAVALRTGSVNDLNRLIAFNSSGDLIFDENVDESVRELVLEGDYLFIKSDTGAVRVNTRNSEKEVFDCQSGKLLVYDESTAIVCGESKAVYIKFEKQ
ncbi:MAG: hypothetical protein E7641_00570 [Ruminococcaceae bacterium]|nr:hypothetical protein [Oscillospiraceae bacterium]